MLAPNEAPGTQHQKPEHPWTRVCTRVLDLLCGGTDIVFPWILAGILGVLTATTAAVITVSSDYLTDLRSGFCHRYWLVNRDRCCGGEINVAEESCRSQTGVNSAQYSLEIYWSSWEHACGARASFAVYFLGTVILAGLSSYLVYSYSPVAHGSGIPDVKAAASGFANERSFTPITLLAKVVGLSLVVGAGLSLGTAGPLVQVGVCWAYIVRSDTGLLGALAGTVQLHDLIFVGAAAGLSVAFGSPIGGVLFVVEELSSVCTLTQRALLLTFAGSFSASFALKSLNLYSSRRRTFFNLSTPTYSPSKEWVSWEVAIFLLLGIIGGLGGSLFIKMNVWISKLRRKRAMAGWLWFCPQAFQAAILKYLPGCVKRVIAVKDLAVEGEEGDDFTRFAPIMSVFEVLLIAASTATVNYYTTVLLRKPMVMVILGLFETCPSNLGASLGLCDESGQHSFNASVSLMAVLPLAALVRLVETTITFDAMIPAGLFIPSLFAGALFGRLIGIWSLELYLSIIGTRRTLQIDPGGLALVGAVAMLSGVARMPVTIVVIMLELTGELNYVVPFMCAALTAKLVGELFTVSIYDSHAVLLGFARLEEPTDIRFSPLVSDVVEPCADSDIFDISAPIPIEMLAKRIEDWQLSGEIGAADISSPSTGRQIGHVEQRSGLEAVVLTKDGVACGVLEKARLRWWLAGKHHMKGATCAFDPALCRSASDVSANPTPLDASKLLEARYAPLLGSAPLLTALCAFREAPQLQYCVVRDETGINFNLALLSRTHFDKVLKQEKFSAAFRDLPLDTPVSPIRSDEEVFTR